MFFLLFWHDGRVKFEFGFFRTLIAFVLSLFAVIIQQLLREVKYYTKKLCTKSTWTLEELMKLTKKNEKETKNIISHVLEVSFTVDPKCIVNWDELNS